MPTAYYVLPANSPAQTISTATKQRAVALECTLCVGDPTGKVTAFPSAVVISTQVPPAVFPDTAGQATLPAIKSAETVAATAEKAHAAALVQAKTQVTQWIGQLSANETQARTDLATLATSSDPIAPIVARIITDSLAMAQVVADILVLLNDVTTS